MRASKKRRSSGLRASARARRDRVRNMREAGGSIVVKSIYKVLLNLIGPTTAIDRAVQIYNRAYSEGRCEIIENARGRAVVRYVDGRPSSGCSSRTARTTWLVSGKLMFEVSVTYDAA